MRLVLKDVAEVQPGDVVGGKVESDGFHYIYQMFSIALTVENVIGSADTRTFKWKDSLTESFPYKVGMDQFVVIETE